MRAYRLIVDPDTVDKDEMNRRRDTHQVGRQYARDQIRAEQFNDALGVLQGCVSKGDADDFRSVVLDMLELMKVSVPPNPSWSDEP